MDILAVIGLFFFFPFCLFIFLIWVFDGDGRGNWVVGFFFISFWFGFDYRGLWWFEGVGKGDNRWC